MSEQSLYFSVNGCRAPSAECSLSRLRAGLSHMELSYARRFNESSLRTQGPIRRGLSVRRWSRGLFLLLRPGVMGPSVRRDDLLSAALAEEARSASRAILSA